jgi:DNA-binding beta-propeller fold protein YncE
MPCLPRLPIARILGVFALLATASAASGQSFLNFESGQVRPLALAPGGNLLLAVNTPDNRLAIFDLDAGGLTLAAEIPVGLEPIAVAARTNTAGRVEAWVVNHLSDSVSIVEIDPGDVTLSRVTRTLLVGDEPRDVVFAGSGGSRAFITCAHRGQNRPGDPQLTTSGVGRADVWTFNANSLGAALGGTPLSIVQLFTDTPRALAVSPDGATVYAAGFHSGNRTTTILELSVSNNSFGLTRPPAPQGATPNEPNKGVIVRFNPANNRWEDGETAQDWTPLVKWSIPDRDVFLINANANPPALVTGGAAANSVVGVGTVIFNMAVRPSNGKVYVANTDAQNFVRFEPMVNGHLAESRITVITGTTPAARHLNPHIDYGSPGDQDEIDASLAFPMDMTFSADGNTLFVVGFGSGKVGAFNANDLETGTITKSLVTVGAGPSGIVLDAGRNRLYVLNRIDQTISIIGNASSPSRAVIGTPVSLGFDPSPAVVKNGRRFLYDARKSGHGDSACASCHIFGDFDSLAWDLGDPFGSVVTNFNPFRVGAGGTKIFHPMKGPMTTQSLRGMADIGPMHWRGDRTGGVSGCSNCALDEQVAFKAFNPAFVGLLGASTQLSTADMQAFTDFILTVRYPPNPIKALDNVPTAAQQAGETFFNGTPVDGGTCQNCHRLPAGADGFSSIEGEPQEFKIAHLRNMYQKVGMFGLPPNPLLPNGLNGGNLVRGTGFLHDGGVSTIFLFLSAPVFAFNNNTERQNVEQFCLSFDTGLRPAVGQQVSATAATFNDANVTGRINLLVARDEANDCDLIVKGNLGGEARGWLYQDASNLFVSDRGSESPISEAVLRGQAASASQERTYTCVPPGSGTRIALDRDLDGFFDRTELDAGTDPADPFDFPGAPSTTSTSTSTTTSTTSSTSTTLPQSFVLIPTESLSLKDDVTAPINTNSRKIMFKSSTRLAPTHIQPPAGGSAGDPTQHGATLTVYNSGGLTDDEVTVNLPSSGWSPYGAGGFRFRDLTGGPIAQVTVRTDSIQVRGGKALWTYILDDPQQGRVAVRLRLGTGATWCTDAPARLSGNPPSTARNDLPGRFMAARKSPAPGSCPALP